MAQPTPNAVISPRYCHSHTIVLKIEKAFPTTTEGNAVVTDTNGNMLFKLNAALLTLHNRRILCDATGNSLLTLHKKIMTAHDRWEAFHGESTEANDLTVTLKRSSLIQFKTKFLANNNKEDVCNFKIKGSWFERPCIIYAGESNTIVAQMHKKHTVQSILIGKGNFMVTVYPNIDYAFIVALIVTLDEINQDEKDYD